MVLFALYPVIFWALAIRWRRRLLGFAVVFLGSAFLLGVCVVHAHLPRVLPGSVQYIQIAQSVLWPYAVLVPAVALYCACLPRRGPTDCVRCGYRMEGLQGETDTCPECGKIQPWALHVRYRPSGLERPSLHHSDAPAIRRPLAAPAEPPPTAHHWSPDRPVPGFTGLARATALHGDPDPSAPSPASPVASAGEHPVQPACRQHPERQPSEQGPSHDDQPLR